MAAFKNVLPLYTSLYLFTQLGLQRKYNPQAFLETTKSILTSASFLGFNLFAGVGVSCLLRNNSDRYYYRVQCFLPGVFASYLALLIERPGRRPALAFYMANMSSELLFKMLVHKGYLRPLPHGETLLFMVGMACWLRFVRIHGFGHDPVSVALKYLIGPLEAKSRARSKTPNCPPALQVSNEDDCEPMLNDQDITKSIYQDASSELANLEDKNAKRLSVLQKLDKQFDWLFGLLFGSHPCCPHSELSCAYYTISPMVTRFSWGYLGRSVMNLVARFRSLRSEPIETIKESFKSKNSLYFGLFLASFVGISRVSHCSLRRYSGKQEDWHSTLAGLLSGSSMFWAPKSTLSIYVIWKCLEQYFFLAVKEGKIKHSNQVICALYAISVDILLYIFAIEPAFIRPSYMKFIDKISDHKLHQLNRLGKFRLENAFVNDATR